MKLIRVSQKSNKMNRNKSFFWTLVPRRPYQGIMTKNPPHNIDTKACRGKMRKQTAYQVTSIPKLAIEKQTDVQTTDDMQTDKRQSQMKRKGTQKQG